MAYEVNPIKSSFKKRLNPKTRKPFKRGEIRKDGMVFRSYEQRKSKADGSKYVVERWVTPDAFKKYVDGIKKSGSGYLNNPSKLGKKIKNPKTKMDWKPGEIREDGYIFIRYVKTLINKSGYLKAIFGRPEVIHHGCIRQILTRKKDKHLKKKLTIEYCKSIFPKNFICPVLGIKMSWLGEPYNSPSLDKIVPSKGYIPGNVAWISYRANTIKNDANIEELGKLIKWLKKNSK